VGQPAPARTANIQGKSREDQVPGQAGRIAAGEHPASQAIPGGSRTVVPMQRIIKRVAPTPMRGAGFIDATQPGATGPVPGQTADR
jgi:hypothetical protein